MEELRCRVCGATQTTRAFQARDNHYGVPGTWWIRRCGGCESLFVEETLSASELERMYPPASYYSYALPQHSVWRRLASSLLGYARPPREPAFTAPGRVLDFGCGAGHDLLRLREQGWSCAGVEIGTEARRVAHEHGLDVRPCIGGPQGFEDASFDYVRANHSLEHVSDPGTTLAEMHRVLRPGGRLFLGLPTASGQNARVFGAHWWHVTAPLHQFVPSTPALVRLVQRAGFRVDRVALNGDAAGTAGSFQIWLNRGTDRRSSQGTIFALRPLLLLGDWVARVQDAFGVGDKVELTATRA